MGTIDSARSKAPVFDVEKLTNQFDDRCFALEIATQFVYTFSDLRAELEVCLKLEEQKQTLSLAHRLRGAADTVNAERIANIAFEIESEAQAYRRGLQTRICALIKEFENFIKAVDDQKKRRPLFNDGPLLGCEIP